MSEEKGLIDRILRGDRNAYAELVRAYQAKVLRLCASLLGESDAEDAAQEIFLKAYRSLASFRKEASFSTWLYRIASNHCRDLLRKRSRQKTEPLDELPESLLSSDDPRAQAEKTDLAEQILLALSPDERLILTLREVQGLSYEEIAEVLSCSLDAVKGRLKRLREALISRLDTFRRLESSKEARNPNDRPRAH